MCVRACVCRRLCACACTHTHTHTHTHTAQKIINRTASLTSNPTISISAWYAWLDVSPPPRDQSPRNVARVRRNMQIDSGVVFDFRFLSGRRNLLPIKPASTCARISPKRRVGRPPNLNCPFSTRAVRTEIVLYCRR